MLYDILTVARKDMKEIFVQRGSLRSGLTYLMIIVIIGGVMFPLQLGREWLTNPLGLVMTSWLPVMMSMGLVADAFAGERERRTLETLLASRLSDQAILYGKMLAALAYGMAVVFTSLLLGALTVNLQYPGAGFYPPALFFGALGLNLLVLLLAVGIGVQVSMHSNNVRQAYQKMSVWFIVLWLPLIIGPQFMPDSWKQQIDVWLQSINVQQVVLFAAAALVVIDLGLVALANARFRRSRLILD